MNTYDVILCGLTLLKPHLDKLTDVHITEDSGLLHVLCWDSTPLTIPDATIIALKQVGWNTYDNGWATPLD